MFATGVKRELNARHFLNGDFGDESIPHSHPYQVELICRSRVLDENGFSTDIAAMEVALEETLSKIDNVLLNDLPFFKDKQSSLENLCRYLALSLRAELKSRGSEQAEPIEIRIWESDTAWASYLET